MPVVFLHGAGARGQLWQNQLLDVPGALAPDLPGHPQGEPLPSIAAYASWLTGWLAGRGPDRALLVGHSMGGAIALEVAIAAPARVAALGLLATGPQLPVDPRLLDLAACDPDAAMAQIAASSHGPLATPASIARTRRALARVAPAVLLADLRACAAFDARTRLSALRLPALVIAGSADRLTPPATTRALAEAIPGAGFAVLPDAGHLLMIEARAALRDVLRPFVSAIRAAS